MTRDRPDVMSSVSIRRLTPADAAAYRSLRLLALEESPTAFGSSHEEEAVLDLERFAVRLAEGAEVWMYGAFVGDALAGITGLSRDSTPKERHRAAIRSMFVRPAARRGGVGRRLLAHVLAVADALPGLRQVTLTVTSGNGPAQRLYEAHGFAAYGRAPEALFVDGRYYDDILMVRFTPR